MGIFDGMAQGLRAAGSVFSPQVGQQLEQERLLESQQGNARQNLMLQQLIKATESGAVDPGVVAPMLKQLGMDLPAGALGPTPEVRAKLIEMKRTEAKAEYLKSPEAQKFISEQDDIGLIRDMARRQLLAPDEGLKAMKEAREANKPIGSGGNFMVPNKAGGYDLQAAPKTTAPHVIYDQDNRARVWDAQTRTFVPAQISNGGAEDRSTFEGTPQQVMAEISRIQDPQERAAVLAAYRNKMAQGPMMKPPTATKAPTGFRYKEDGATLEPIPGGPADQGPMNPADMASAGASAASGMPLTQVLPGYGRQIAGRREQVRAEAINQIKAENPGMTDIQAGTEYANRQIDFVAGKRSVTQLNTMLGATRQAVDQLDFNVGKVTEAMKKLPGSDLSPLFNAIIRQEEKWTGDPAYSELYYYMHAAAMESAKILQGGQASVAQLHAGAAVEAKKWADANFTTPKQWMEGVAPAMKEEGAYRLKTYQSAIEKQRLGANRAPVPTGALNPTLQQALDRYK